MYSNFGDTAVLPGAKVVALVCAHMRDVFREHRKALEGNVDYCQVVVLGTPRGRSCSLSILFDGFTMVGSKSEYGLYHSR